MYNNPFSDETLGAQPTEAYPPMEELQPRPSQQPPTQTAPGESTAHPVPSEEVEEVEARQEEALTIKYAIGKLNDYLGWFLIVLETTLVIRFLLKLIGADPRNLFAGFLYALTDILLFPFMGIVGSPSFHQNQYFEFPTLIAIGIYYLIFWALRRFLRILISSPEEPTE
jgi:YGGT family